jgi:hypothetical protein
MNEETVKLLVALGLILTGGVLVARSAGVPKGERPGPARRKRERREVLQVSGAAPPPAEAATLSSPAPAVFGSSRPRIFTGEPVVGEPDPGAGRRALRLAAGMTVMAAAGAVAILALVRGIVLVVERLG